MVVKVAKNFYNVRSFCSLFGQFINLVVSNDVCAGYDFGDGDIVVGGFSVITIRIMRSLSRWLYWEDGFLMWLRRTYMLLRLFVNMNICIEGALVCSMVIRNAYNFAMRILGYSGRRAPILFCSGPLKTPDPAVLPFLSPSGGVNEPSI